MNFNLNFNRKKKAAVVENNSNDNSNDNSNEITNENP